MDSTVDSLLDGLLSVTHHSPELVLQLLALVQLCLKLATRLIKLTEQSLQCVRIVLASRNQLGDRCEVLLLGCLHTRPMLLDLDQRHPRAMATVIKLLHKANFLHLQSVKFLEDASFYIFVMTQAMSVQLLLFTINGKDQSNVVTMSYLSLSSPDPLFMSN